MPSNFRNFVCFFQDGHKNDWQVQLANTYTLSTALILPLLTFALWVVWQVADSPFAARALPYFAVASGVSVLLYLLKRQSKLGFMGVFLMSLYLLLAFGITWSVGISALSMVVCAWAIILAGTLCGYWCALVPTMLSIVFLSAFRLAELQNAVHPAYVVSPKPDDFSTVVLLALLFHVLAAVSSSLYRLEQTRRQLQEAEESFARQKDLLTTKIKKQSQKLRTAESEKMQQLYRLVEVGEVNTILMHDLANNLTALALEVDGIDATESSPPVRRIKNQIRHINTTLHRSRQQLKGEYKPTVFGLAKEIGHTIDLLQPTAQKAQVKLEWVKPDAVEERMCLGEKVLFQQLMTNIIINAIESYKSPDSQSSSKRVEVALEPQDDNSIITVTDWGVGIKPELLTKVFEPFYTTKTNGMGMGMYLTKRFIESNFGGKIEVSSNSKGTTFTISLPCASETTP